METTSNTSFLSDLFGKLNQYQLSYAYNGEFTKDLTDRILALAETGMETEKESKLNKGKVYFIMVESLQNVTRHQVSSGSNVRKVFFSFKKYKGGYLITSGNTVENSKIESLKKKLEMVNALDGIQLKEYYQLMLTEGSFSDKGGAGLGLIEMARKSGKKLVYDFIPIDNEYSYFYFQSNILDKNSEVSLDALPSDSYNLEMTTSIHKVVSENNLKLFYHGQFGHENLKGLLKMTEGSAFDGETIAFKKTIFALMVEMLQNICFHGIPKNYDSNEKPGLFMVSENENYCSLITGNYINNSTVGPLKEKLNHINSLTPDELDSLFMNVILQDSKLEQRGAGLGFIDIRIKSGHKIEMDISAYSTQLSFLVLKVNVNY